MQLDPWQGEKIYFVVDLMTCGLDDHFVSSRRVDESSLCTRTLNGMGQALDLTGTTPEVP